MANRRMLSKKITDTDMFLDMPVSAQCLYFHLNMNADDDGFVGSPKKIQRTVGASQDDLTILMNKQYIIPFESGVVVIKDWKIHNYIRPDRYYETLYKSEKNQLTTDENNSYSLLDKDVIPNDNRMSYQREPQVRLDEDRLEIGKVSVEAEKDNNASSDDDLIPIFNFWEQNGFGMLPPLTMEHLEKWVEDFQEIGATRQDAIEIVLFSLHRGVEGNGKTYNYINTILKNWESSLFLTVTQIKAEDPFLNRQKKQERPKLSYEQYDDDEPYF